MPLLDPTRLEALANSLLLAAGASQENAACVAASLVSANLAGHDSHGVQKLPSYVRDVRNGSLKPDARPRVVREGPTTAVVDGMGTFGHVGANFSVDVAVEKARASGLAAVSTTHCHHTGRLGRWVEKIAQADLIGMMMGAEGHPPYKVAPFGGKEGALATNPIAWAVPCGPQRPPILLDYATSVVSIGKLQLARDRSDAVPPGWILDSSGRPSSAVDDFFDGGLLLPFGGYKGYALSVIAELLAVGLSAGDRVPAGERASSLFTLAFVPTLFRDTEDFQAHVQGIVVRLKSAEPASSSSEVLVPGEPESRSRESRKDAIPVSETIWRGLRELGEELGLDAASFD